jgi:hypothetical protein
MAGITRTLEFSEGVTVDAPVTTFLQTTQFATYADDATFVTNKGSAAADGDAYYNTTSDVVRIYANGAWQTIYDDSDSNVALLAGTQTFSGDKTFSSAVNISDSTSSTDKDTGALIVEGGVGIEENLNVGGNGDITGNLTVDGNLTVSGTTTTVDTTNMDVKDANITLNKGGNQTSADLSDSGLTVEMSDATDALMHYDSTATSKWKCGESGSTKEVVTISDSQIITNKDIDGQTASNSNRVTLPKNTTANLSGLTRKAGTLVFDTDTLKVKYDDGTSLNTLVDLNNPMTTDGDLITQSGGSTARVGLGTTNQVLYSNGTLPTWGFDIKDEDDLTSNSASALVTQQSVKAYIDNQKLYVSAYNTSGTSFSVSGTFYDISWTETYDNKNALSGNTFTAPADMLVIINATFGVIDPTANTVIDTLDTRILALDDSSQSITIRRPVPSPADNAIHNASISHGLYLASGERFSVGIRIYFTGTGTAPSLYTGGTWNVLSVKGIYL